MSAWTARGTIGALLDWQRGLIPVSAGNGGPKVWGALAAGGEGVLSDPNPAANLVGSLKGKRNVLHSTQNCSGDGLVSAYACAKAEHGE